MPLTGEPLENESQIPDRPALVVKVSNAGPNATPQSGLNATDLIFEEIVEGGSTRLAAIFHSRDAETVGPVRSGRAQDINMVTPLNRPLFAWSGGNPAVRAAVRNSDLIDLDAVFSPGYYRRTGKTKPNNLYSSTEALWAQTTDEAGRPPVVFPYLRAGEELTGELATRIEVELGNVRARWEYDPATQRYFRSQNGQDHNTEMDGGVEQIWVDNVVVMLANYGTNDFDGNPDAQVLGTNPVYVFTGGTVRVGAWLRFMPEDPYQFFDNFDDLNRLSLHPGRTWMEIPHNVDGVVTWDS